MYQEMELWVPYYRLKEEGAEGKVVGAAGALCHAGWMLVSAGILKGRKATSFFSIKDDLVAAGANWVDAEVVVDGNLITSRRPDDLPAFCRAIVAAPPQAQRRAAPRPAG